MKVKRLVAFAVRRNNAIDSPPVMTCPEPSVGYHFSGKVRLDPLGMLDYKAIKVGNIETAIWTSSEGSRAEPRVLASQKFALNLSLRPCCLHENPIPRYLASADTVVNGAGKID